MTKQYLKQAILGLLILLTTAAARAQGFDAAYKPLHSSSYVKDKNFYLLTLFDSLPGVNKAITKLPELSGLWKKKLKGLTDAANNCNESAGRHVAHLSWTNTEITDIGDALAQLYHEQPAVKEMVTHHLRRSGYYANYAKEKDVDLLVLAWKDAATAMNRIMSVYALGEKPKYPDIDSASYDVKAMVYRKNINIIANTLNDLAADSVKTFYDAALHFSLDLLQLNMRDEAGRLEPHNETNAAAVSELRNIDWTRFRYSAIVIPGAGPDIISARIDPWAISRLRVAVERYRRGEAPVLIVSGGFVKPFQTPYSEGVEMKRYLMQAFKIPENKIILEPYARHTTTNIRNAVRLMTWYKFPLSKKVLIITDQYQTHTIQSNAFKKRCLDELGYMPFLSITPKTKTDTEFVPNTVSMHLNARDPLDP